MSFYKKARLKSMRDKMMQVFAGKIWSGCIVKMLTRNWLIAVILAGFFG